MNAIARRLIPERKIYPFYDMRVIPAQSAYDALTLPMRRALDYYAWACWKPKPHPNTVRALEKRGIVYQGKITLYGCALYRAYGRHDREVQHGHA